MDPYKASNPVERRLLKVNNDWRQAISSATVRFIFWKVPAEDIPVLETFFQIQSETANGVRAYSGEFRDGEQYTLALINHLCQFYDSRREGSRQKGIKADWLLPLRDEDESVQLWFLRVLKSLSDYHPDLFPFYSFILTPFQVSAERHFSSWFNELFAIIESMPWHKEHLMFVTWGEEDAWLNDLHEQYPQKIALIANDYRTQNIATELLAESTDRSAGADLRRIFVDLLPIVKEKNPAKLEQLTSRAFSICEQQKWFDQSVVVSLLAGAAYLNWKDKDKSLLCYRQGVLQAQQARENQHPAGGKLVANALFGEASVYLVDKDYEKAARCYSQIPFYTAEAQDYILTVEAWRMVTWCFKKSGHKKEARESGFQALEAGLLLEKEMRMNSSLPEAAQLLTTLMPPDHQDFDEMDEKLTVLFGDEWEEVLSIRQKSMNTSA
ncbi:hypothetical protein GWD52_09095 [Enterobacteriaceae bacterium 4M9]|nr:hypothetical protein [Enterobacteriaceae bacterium 4M9]